MFTGMEDDDELQRIFQEYKAVEKTAVDPSRAKLDTHEVRDRGMFH